MFAVREDEMAVEVCAVVVEGSVSTRLQVSISTEDGTALGESIHHRQNSLSNKIFIHLSFYNKMS